MPAQESRLHSYMHLEMLIDVLVYLTIQVVGTWVPVVPLVFWDLHWVPASQLGHVSMLLCALGRLPSTDCISRHPGPLGAGERQVRSTSKKPEGEWRGRLGYLLPKFPPCGISSARIPQAIAAASLPSPDSSLRVKEIVPSSWPSGLSKQRLLLLLILGTAPSLFLSLNSAHI